MDYIEVVIGLILVLILSITFGLIFGSLGSYLGFLAATILIGYRANGDIATGALYGTFAAVLAGVVFTLVMVLMSFFTSMGPGASMMELGFLAIIIGLMVDGLIGSMGGAIGSFIWNKTFSKTIFNN
ncbi:MAG: DUF5518 domain-containing protein [Methanobacteriaceae archaeon]|nr:DUF5518 domain-containing protein [Methanobacteriaceae archaeon]